ncbi:DUF1801 domain-containing protein [Aquimarina sp. MMG016]|uniref:DUF1801 domain-containing protein n=1 Tax=Aquimarina sp. MMG016 TaxID=2822690 RepID=UPI001B39F5D5|nr:DUF1801 domain-containing protein [Aquimarina sp. MMG016]MBQ4821865.1 DUF1801 domain-containing protein [Aquimarina sp. MMG016]
MRFAKKHITLGFYNIDKIKAPDNLLEGKGNTLKHIKIKRAEDIKIEMFINWLNKLQTKEDDRKWKGI